MVSINTLLLISSIVDLACQAHVDMAIGPLSIIKNGWIAQWIRNLAADAEDESLIPQCPSQTRTGLNDS